MEDWTFQCVLELLEQIPVILHKVPRYSSREVASTIMFVLWKNVRETLSDLLGTFVLFSATSEISSAGLGLDLDLDLFLHMNRVLIFHFQFYIYRELFKNIFNIIQI